MDQPDGQREDDDNKDARRGWGRSQIGMKVKAGSINRNQSMKIRRRTERVPPPHPLPRRYLHHQLHGTLSKCVDKVET